MGLFDLFKKKPKAPEEVTPEEVMRAKIRGFFDDAVRSTLVSTSSFVSDLLRERIIEHVILVIYNEMKKTEQLQKECVLHELNYQQLLKEECIRTFHMHLGSKYSTHKIWDFL